MSRSEATSDLTAALTSGAPATTGASARSYWERGRRSAAFVLLLTVALVALADLLFYRQAIGWTIGIFALAVVLATTLRSARYLGSRAGQVIGVGLILLIASLIEHPGPLRISLALLGIMSVAAINARDFTTDVFAWLARWGELIARWFIQLPIDAVGTQRWRMSHGGRTSRTLKFALNWLIPLALSLIFIGLFAAANPIISRWISTISDATVRFFNNISQYVSIGRVILWLVIGLPIWALLRARLRWLKDRKAMQLTPVAIAREPLISIGLLVRCLVVFNFVFAVQLSLDMATVLSQGSTLPEGMTYAQYARRGAYPLVATALLAAAFVLLGFPSGPRASTSRAARWLVYLWITQNIVLTGSAIWRLWMYVDAFGLTRLRVAAAIWMLLVALGLTYIIWRIVAERSNAWLLRVNTLTLLIVLFACCFINFDRVIAWEGALNNYELRGEGSPRLDLRYMRKMGIDAIPALEWFAAQVGPDDPVGQAAAGHALALRQELKTSLATWQGWTLRRHRLANESTTSVSLQP
jgi:hypothetical protein